MTFRLFGEGEYLKVQRRVFEVFGSTLLEGTVDRALVHPHPLRH